MKNHNLFDNYPTSSSFWDEMISNELITRDHYQLLKKVFSKYSPKDLNEMQDLSNKLFVDQGVTFTVYNDKKGTEKIFPFDIFPRIITSKEWQLIEHGIKQRIKAINYFIKDIYNEKFIIRDGIISSKDIFLTNNFIKEMNSLSVPFDIYTHIAGVDLIRNNDGKFYVLEDNLRTPSGVSYMLENREISKRILPGILNANKVRPIMDYPIKLYNKLKSLSLNNNPNIVLLTPGIFNSAYYEHSTLARLMGVELVEGQDLVVKDNFVFMKNAGGLKKVDVIYRRIDDLFLDPLVFNSQSILGIASLMSVYREGNVVLVNAPGCGIADDKAIYRFVPEIIKYYLNEEPMLNNIKTYVLSDPDQLDYVLKNINDMVIKKTDGSGGYGMLIGRFATEKKIEDYVNSVVKNPINYIAQHTLSLSTSPCYVDERFSPRCVDLRPFALMGSDGIDVSPGGLTRVALEKGSLVVNSSQGGGSKDTWVLNT